MDKSKIRQFMKDWKNTGEEIRDTDNFWNELLTALGVSEPTKVIKREKLVYVNGSAKSIDIYLEGKRVLVEQKSLGIDLDAKEKQSDGACLTPYEQGRRYAGFLTDDERVTKIITCNFGEFRIYDLNQKRPELNPTVIKLSELDKKAHIFDFVLKDENAELPPDEEDVSVKAGKYIKELYDMFLEQYGSDDSETLKSLNILCVRLVFLFYCEDAEIFKKDQFLEYLKDSDDKHIGTDLAMLFDVLNTKEDERKKYLSDELKAFPYVNGGLFEREIDMPSITGEILDKIKNLSLNFDWSGIDPTVFGACFESTLNPDTRRKGGMHYTSLENIHKVIDTLFLTDLQDELDEILGIKSPNNKKWRLDAFQEKLASLKILDPACGSGNFLTETYLCLRKMENKVIEEKMAMDPSQITGQVMAGAVFNPIKVSIQQFYGIEINDFAVSVAMTALWIAEAQMIQKTMEIVHQGIDFLPLETLPNIREGNALRIDWEDVVSKYELSYICGNPPFHGSSRTDSKDIQKEDLSLVFGKEIKHGKLDYVAGWYWKAANYINLTNIKCAFVSTNSITQGEQVSLLWRPLFEQKNIEIDFAYHSFIWENEASEMAAVVCVIIGFSNKSAGKVKTLYSNDSVQIAEHINGYLIDMPDLYIQSRGNNLSGFPKIIQGNKPWDGGHLLLSEEKAKEFVKKYPDKEFLIRPFYGGDELLNGKKRFCFWLKDVNPLEYIGIKEIEDRLEGVRDARLKTKTKAVQEQANTPALFSQIRQPSSDYLAIPEVSTNNRDYIPISYLTSNDIASNKLFIIPNASLYMFGVLISNVHMAWMRVVSGRLGNGYSYSPSVYNNFPWPNPTEQQRRDIEKTAESILYFRQKHNDMSLSQMYDKLYMPTDLLLAHWANNTAVLAAYGVKKGDPEFHDESACNAMLMKMYQKLTQE